MNPDGKRILVTGVSSGVGRALLKRLIFEGNEVWGVARRENLLKDLKKELGNSPKFNYLAADVSKVESWKTLIVQMKEKGFFPETVIFNAAINDCDLDSGLDTEVTRKVFEVNLFGILEGIRILLKEAKSRMQFIAISSSSALKGNRFEGIGYPASKAALSIAFESLQQQYKDKYSFKTIFFGPISSGMGPFKKKSFLVLSEDQAVSKIILAIKGSQIQYYFPGILFFGLRVVKFLPSNLYFKVLSKMENLRTKISS